MLKKVSKNILTGTVYASEHMSTAGGVSSNIHGYTEGKCVIEEDPSILVDKMLEYIMHEIQQCAFKIAKEKWGYVIKQLEQQVEKLKPQNNLTKNENEQGNVYNTGSNYTDLDYNEDNCSEEIAYQEKLLATKLKLV